MPRIIIHIITFLQLTLNDDIMGLHVHVIKELNLPSFKVSLSNIRTQLNNLYLKRGR